jgi:NitT/TauT family transport system substrate-binding protein
MVAGAFLAARASAAGPMLPLRVATQASDSTGLVFYAQDMGFLHDAGLDVEITIMRNTAAQLAALLAGSIDIASTSFVTLATLKSRGLDVRMIAPSEIYVGKPTIVVMTPKASSVRSAADFAGKTLAVNGLGDSLQTLLLSWLDANKGNSAATNFIEMPMPEIGVALRQGRVDGGILAEPFATAAKADCRVVGDACSSVAKTFVMDGYCGNAAWLSQNREAARRFAGAMNKAARWANAHRTETAAILARYTKISADTVLDTVRATYGENVMTDEVVQPVITVAAKYLHLRDSIVAADLIWRS